MEYHFKFLEVNPIVKLKNDTSDSNINQYIPLDMAGLIDETALYLLQPDP